MGKYYKPTRKIILHADDLGMHLSTISAFETLYHNRSILSGSLMAPCPWFMRATKIAQQCPDADLGLHLTLTSEWHNYRWGPIGSATLQSGLIDDSGVYFHQTVAKVKQLANVQAVKDELAAQIDFAKNVGFNPTHLDCHMFCASQPEFLPTTIALALDHKIPIVISKQMLSNLDDATAQLWSKHLNQANNPIFDSITGLHIDFDRGEISQQLHQQLKQLEPGLHYVYSHPIDSIDELDMSKKQAENRYAEYRALLYTDLDFIQPSYQIDVTTFRRLAYNLF